MEKSDKIWSLSELLNWSLKYLSEKGVEDARTSTEWMLCYVLNFSRVDLYLNFDRPMTRKELDSYRPLLLQCAARKPVQQIIGECDFFGLKLAINDQVLTPRPETELLVETCLKMAEKHTSDTLRILDIGSGSGAVAISLAMNLPQAHILAIEKSQEALKVFKQNCNFYNLVNRVEFLQQDIFTWETELTFDIIVSNPPYIADSEMTSLDTRVSHYEPYMALSDGEDGLKFYKHYSKRFNKWLKPDGFALLEFGGNPQLDAVKMLFKEYGNVQIIKDYQAQARHISFYNSKID